MGCDLLRQSYDARMGDKPHKFAAEQDSMRKLDI